MSNLAKAELPSHKIDGADIWPLLGGAENAKAPHKAFYFYYHVNQLQAIRSGKWKLYAPHQYRTLAGRPGGTNGIPAKYENRKVAWELYDLESDLAEQRNLAKEHPEVVRRLQTLLDNARADLGDSLTKAEGKGTRAAGRIE